MEKVLKFAEKNLSKEITGKGIDKAMRIRSMALRLWEDEGGNKKIIETVALTSDICNSKIFSNLEGQRKKIREFLDKNNYTEYEKGQIMDLIEMLSSTNDYMSTPMTVEGKILQDAKRLDEIGAMGIVRTFASGGAKAQEVYKEGQEALDEVAFTTYSKDGNSCINEFYDRLLKLKDLMNTETGAKLAEKRHNYMMNFLVEFYQEWKGLK